MASHALRCFVLKTESISLRLTHALTHNRKNRCGNKGHKSRYARIFPRGKPAKDLEISIIYALSTFVISRSRVQVTSPAPKTKEPSQNESSAAALFLWSNMSRHTVIWRIFVCWGTTKPTLPQKQGFLWKSFQFETAMLPEYQKDVFVSGRFPASSTAFSN